MKIAPSKSCNRLICEDITLESNPLFGALVAQTLAIFQMTNIIIHSNIEETNATIVKQLVHKLLAFSQS